MIMNTFPKSKKVLFFSPYGSWLIHNQVDAIVASALRLRGCEVLVVGCNGFYGQECCLLPYTPMEKRSEHCRACAQTGQQFFSQSFQLPYLQLNNFVTTEELTIANHWVETLQFDNYVMASYNDIPIGQWVISSVYSHFRISAKGLSRPEVQAVHRDYLRDGLATYFAFSRLLDAHRPTHVFLFNGRFLPYRIAFEVAKQRQLDVLVHERGFLDDSFGLLDNHPCTSNQSQLALVKAWESIPIGNSELQEVKQYFSQRELGKNTNWPGFYDFKTDYGKLREMLRIPKEAKIVAVFTSSEDELATTEDFKEVLNQLAIIDRLIEIFAHRPEYLVIRHHPNIGGQSLGGMISMSDTHFVAAAYRQALSIPKNVRIIMPAERLTSYALLWHTQAAITFFSTIAVESAARGVPTASMEASTYSAALPHVIRKTDKNSLSQLVDELLSENSYPQLHDLQKLYRFTHTYFFKFSTKFRSFGVKNQHQADIRITRFEELQPGHDLALDRVCDRLLTNAPLFIVPTSSDLTRYLSEEETFLRQEQQEIQQHRKEVRKCSSEQPYPSSQKKVAVICLRYREETDEPNQLFQAWQYQSRHEEIVDYYCHNLDLTDHYQIISAILTVLVESQEDYFLVTHSLIQYDEAFLSTAIDLLSDENTLNGIMTGGYLSSLKGEIEQEIFTRRCPNLTYQHAVDILPSLQYVPFLLAFFLLRKETLISILQSIQKLPMVGAAAEKLFELLINTPHLHKIDLPMWIMQQSSQVQNFPRWEETRQDRSLFSQDGYQVKTPVAFLIFNRPETTEKVFQAIRQARPSKLLVIADGPRPNRPGETQKCAAARAIIKQVDWPCEVLTNYSDTNLGCRNRVSSGITWVFNTVEEAIILEDDCLPHPSFFRFCDELLEQYRHDARIMLISGDNFQFGQKRGEYSYYFSRYNHIWGWASWRRAWQRYDLGMRAWPQAKDNQWLANIFENNPRAIEFWSNIFEAAYQGFNTWDYAWTFAFWQYDGLAILPNRNLISNIGFGPEATHTTQSGSHSANLIVETMLFPLQHPPTVNRNVEADIFTEKTLFSGGEPTAPEPTDLLIRQAFSCLNTNQNSEALAIFTQLLQQNQPELISLNYGKAVALQRLGQIPEAVETLKHLLTVMPSHEKGRQLLAELHPNFLEVQRTFLNLSSQTRDPISLPKLMQQAQHTLTAGDPIVALNLLSQAKALKQPTLNLDTLRAMCFLKLNQVGAAWQALLEELRFFPDNQEAKNWLQQIETQVPQLKIGQIQDPEFQDLFKLIRPHTMLSEARLYSLFSLVKRICVENLPGNVVECGVAGGGSTALMALVIKRYSRQPRWLYAFDSFEGLPAPTTIDKHEGAPAESTGWGTGTCAGSEEHLRNLCTQLGIVDVVKPIKGYFQDSLPRMRNWVGMIALLHLDGDWYESTQVILQQFYDRIVNGGILQIDDYGYWEGCRRAVHEFETTRSLKFDLKPIDDTGVWCVKPDQFPVNPVLERSLISEFSQDDPMSLGIQSQMSQNERFQLYYAVRKELRISTDKPVRFIEIGSFAGASLLLTCRAFHRITPHFQGFAIEPNRHPQLMQLVPQLKPQVTHLPMLSQQALPQLQQQFEQDGNFPVFIFVDGDHSYEGVWQDAIDYFQLLAPGGLMIFHDCLPALNAENREAILFHHGGQEPGVRRAFEELVECTYGEVVELPLLFPSDPTQTQAYLPIIPGVFSTLRAYRKGME